MTNEITQKISDDKARRMVVTLQMNLLKDNYTLVSPTRYFVKQGGKFVRTGTLYFAAKPVLFGSSDECDLLVVDFACSKIRPRRHREKR